jgi:hypothetical protein
MWYVPLPLVFAFDGLLLTQALTQDQETIRHRLSLGQVIKSRNMYQMGGSSFPVAKLTLVAPRDTHSFPSGTKVYGFSKDRDHAVLGTLLEPVNWVFSTPENITLEIAYFSSLFEDLEEENACRVGGFYTTGRGNFNGCFTDESGVVELVVPGQEQGTGEVFPYVYDIRRDNVNYRTLQSLSTQETEGNMPCPNCAYFEDFAAYLEYYGDANFGDKWILAASFFNSTDFSSKRGDADFSAISKIGVAEGMLTGIVQMNVMLRIIQGLEQAITSCQASCDTVQCNEVAIGFLDQAVALYCGSLEGKDGTGEGVFQFALAQRRATQFGLDQSDKTTNARVIELAQNFQDLLLQGNCAASSRKKHAIISLLKVPLVQSVLRYAYVRDVDNIIDEEELDKAEAFGATYTAAILPLVHKCNRADANILYESLRFGSKSSDISFHRVKDTLEKNYYCLGVTCSDIGGISTPGGFAEGAEPCVGSSALSSKTDSSGGGFGTELSILGASLGVVVVVILVYRHRKRKPRFKPRHHRSFSNGGNIAAVSTIS